MKIRQETHIAEGKMQFELVFTMTKSNWDQISAEDKSQLLGFLRGRIGDILGIIEKVDKIPLNNTIEQTLCH